jgi:hypothetical protein
MTEDETPPDKIDEIAPDKMVIDEWYETLPEGSVNWSRAYFAVLWNHVIIIGAMTPLTARIVQLARDHCLALNVELARISAVFLVDLGPWRIMAISVFATLAVAVMALIRRQLLGVLLSSLTFMATAVFLFLGIASAFFPLLGRL